jgi:hypothetical protein
VIVVDVVVVVVQNTVVVEVGLSEVVGGGVRDVFTKSKRFGDSSFGSLTAPLVASDLSFEAICEGVAEGSICKRRAAAPAT